MEKKKLTSEEIAQLQNSYEDITGDLFRYRRLFRERRYREAKEQDREIARKQYKFLKISLNSLIDTLIATDGLTIRIVKAALFNRFLKIKTKWAIVRHLLKKNTRICTI